MDCWTLDFELETLYYKVQMSNIQLFQKQLFAQHTHFYLKEQK